jgi:micrococcal nuclease
VSKPGPAYTYAATVVRVVDGDTVRLDVDLGFATWMRNVPFRLSGCNALELAAPGGREARDHLATLLPPGTMLTIRSVKTDKYARWDADILMPDGTHLVDRLIADGWAAPWSGAGAAPIPDWPRPPIVIK